MKVIRISRPDLQDKGYMVPMDDWKASVLTEIENDIEEAERGRYEYLSSIVVTIEEISQEEFDSLEEFMGW
jgi:serine/threonine protein kinase HipA of HipAB toxin-antitoxin module